jgi:hypothetical protein
VPTFDSFLQNQQRGQPLFYSNDLSASTKLGAQSKPASKLTNGSKPISQVGHESEQQSLKEARADKPGKMSKQ